MISNLQLLTVLFGVIATLVPGYFAVYFFRGKGIARVLSYMMAGESISMAVALLFSWYSYIGLYDSMSEVEMVILRWVIFSTGLFSSLHLIAHILHTKQVIRES